MADQTLNALIDAVAHGDRTAFRSLYNATSAKLFGVALRILKSREMAEDVLQDVYLKVWDAAPDYRPELGTPFSWMVAITRNRAIDVLRKRREVATDDDAHEAENNPDSGPDPFELAAQSRALKSLLGCMERLEPEHRRCLLMAYYYGYTHEEIADRVSKPVGTVKSWIRRGLIRVRDCLDNG